MMGTDLAIAGLTALCAVTSLGWCIAAEDRTFWRKSRDRWKALADNAIIAATDRTSELFDARTELATLREYRARRFASVRKYAAKRKAKQQAREGGR